MRNPLRRHDPVPPDVLARAGLTRGERVLARTTSVDGSWLLGTRDALVLVPADPRVVEQSRVVEERARSRVVEERADPRVVEERAGERLETTPAAVVRIPWERVETADWNRDEERLRVTEVADFGHPRPVHELALSEPGPLLAMIRERVTASVLLQRRVPVQGRLGLTVLARRPPRGTGEVVWAYDLDPGLDPEDPAVRAAAEGAVRAAQDELGPGQQPMSR